MCLSVHGGSTWAGTPLRTRYIPKAGTPSQDQVHPPEPGTPGDQVHPPGRYTPLGPGTPLRDQVHPPPPGAVHDWRYGQQAGGTHPTGMHSCYNNRFFHLRNSEPVSTSMHDAIIDQLSTSTPVTDQIWSFIQGFKNVRCLIKM